MQGLSLPHLIAKSLTSAEKMPICCLGSHKPVEGGELDRRCMCKFILVEVRGQSPWSFLKPYPPCF